MIRNIRTNARCHSASPTRNDLCRLIFEDAMLCSLTYISVTNQGAKDENFPRSSKPSNDHLTLHQGCYFLKGSREVCMIC